MNQEVALTLSRNKFGESQDLRPDLSLELVNALDRMPPAISQAVAFICKRRPVVTIEGYLKSFRNGEKNFFLKLPKIVEGTNRLSTQYLRRGKSRSSIFSTHILGLLNS